MRVQLLTLRSVFSLLPLLSAQAFASDVKDPFFKDQWSLKNSGQVLLRKETDLKRVRLIGKANADINWQSLQEINLKKNNVVVAVLDSGVDINHPDLKNNIWFNEKACLGDEKNAYKDCYGRNVLDGNNDLIDEVGHGTHVAGLIAAVANEIGIRGVADSGVKILPVKVLNQKVNGFSYNNKLVTSIIAEGMNYAISKNVDVINLSLGWPKIIDTPEIRKAFEVAYQKNIIVIAASGNNNKDLPTYPCSYSNVICVGAIDNQGQMSEFSNFGDRVDFVAPGVGMISTFPNNLESRTLRMKGYEVKDGSSQAAPLVAGIAAAIRAVNPELSVDEVKNILISSAQKTLFNDESKKFINYGLVNMKAALDLAQTSVKDRAILVNKENDEVLYDENLTFKYTLPLQFLKKDGSEKKSTVVCIESLSKAIGFEETCVETEENKVVFNGKIIDQFLDSHIELKAKVNGEAYRLNLILSKKVSENQLTNLLTLENVDFNKMALVQPGRKISKLAKIIDRYSLVSKPEYYFLDPQKQTENTVISFLGEADKVYGLKEINLKQKVDRVLSIHRADINLDGKADIFIYAMSKDRLNLEFYLFNDKLQPLFGKDSKWTFPLSVFEGLKIDGQKEQFNWTQIQTTNWGTIQVPAMLKSHVIPEIDNSSDILLNQKKARNHLFYFEPVKSTDKIQLRLRVLDNVNLEEKLLAKLGVRNSRDMKNAYLVSLLAQTHEDVKESRNRAIYILDNHGDTVYYEVTYSPKEKDGFSIKTVDSGEQIETALAYDMTDAQTGKIGQKKMMTYLLSRSSAQLFTYDEGRLGSELIVNNAWENPILALIGSFDLGSETKFLFENRYSISLVSESGKVEELPVYRDSSFPGQSFSEGIKPILINSSVALYVNSTLVFGNRVYSMTDTQNQGFIRPIAHSVSIPENCLALNAESWDSLSDYKYMFLCKSNNGNVTLNSLSLSHE